MQVTVIASEGKNVLNVQELAPRAWRAVGKQVTVDGDGEGAGFLAIGTLRCPAGWRCVL